MDYCKKAYELRQGMKFGDMSLTEKNIWYPIFRDGWKKCLDAVEEDTKGKVLVFK